MPNYYAVKAGRKTGIYESWEDCKKQVHGFPGAIFKKWKTKEEAELYLEKKTEVFPETEREDESLFSDSKRKSVKEKQDDPVSEDALQEALFQKYPTEAIAFVDGSYQKDSGTYGYGVVFFLRKELTAQREGRIEEKGSGTEEAYREMRNVSGEILAACRAVELALQYGLHSLSIFHDYQGISSWATGEWKCNKEKTKAYRKFMQDAEKKIKLEFVKVPAHSGIYFNELADRLAKEAVGIQAG